MTSIIQRYLLREILRSSLATTLVLFVILMSNTLGSLLSDIAEGELPGAALWPALIGQAVSLLSMLLPLGLFLGIVFAFGRLYKDHELVALQACGFGYDGLYRAVMGVALPAALLTALISLWAGPEALRYAKGMVDANRDVNRFEQLRPGHFNSLEGGKLVFYMQSLSADRRRIEGVIVGDRRSGRESMELAREGSTRMDPRTGDVFLELGEGRRYEGRPGRQDYRIIEYERHGILLKKKKLRQRGLYVDEKSTAQLLDSPRSEDRAELWWRIALPVTLLVLAFLATPLAWISPRQGRYGKVGLAVLSFIVYLNLLGLSRSALETGRLPLWLNYWWVHALFVVFALWLLGRRTGGLWRRRKPA